MGMVEKRKKIISKVRLVDLPDREAQMFLAYLIKPRSMKDLLGRYELSRTTILGRLWRFMGEERCWIREFKSSSGAKMYMLDMEKVEV